MRAKFINEKFTEKSDPVKDMNIGFDLEKYIDNKLVKYNYTRPYFNEAMGYYFTELTEKEDLVKLIFKILKNTPIEYQKTMIDNYILIFLEGQEVDTKNYNKI
jgi:hypothetical protein